MLFAAGPRNLIKKHDPTTDPETLNVYNKLAAPMAEQYESADLAQMHRLLVRFLPAGGRVLEVGCGSGRDAAFLHAQGFTVTAMDGSAGMLAELAARHPELADHAVSKTFPMPADDPFLAANTFDGLTCLAMLMHVPNHALFECARQFSVLLRPGGVLVLSFSTGRAGLVQNRDEQGRLYIERPPEQIQLLLERLGFRLLARDDQTDSLNRELRWTVLVMENASTAPGLRAVDQIESVISKDKKDATYKLALLRALCAIAQTESQAVQWKHDGFMDVPLGLVAEKWLFYYWPLIEPDPDRKTVIIPQKRGLETHMRLAFRTPLWELTRAYAASGIGGAYADFKSARIPAPLRPLWDRALNAIAGTIVSGPVKYTGGSQKRHFEFMGRRTAKGKCTDPRSASAGLGRIRVPAAMWRELSLIGQWIGESLILRWAELTHEISNQSVPVTTAVERLLIQPEPERDVQLARSIYSAASGLACVWTQEPLRAGWHVDHAVPYSVWHNNDLWNLFPCNSRANADKSDKLVTARLAHKSRDRIIHCWELLNSHAAERFSIEISRSLLHDTGMTNWQSRAFAGFVENLELVAAQRGADRWDGPGEARQRTRPASGTTAKSGRPALWSYPDVAADAFTAALPFVGALAAGPWRNGFEFERLEEECRDASWVKLPGRLCGPKRFVVEVAGDSMAPTFRRGDWLVFEYHRTPRQNGQIAIVCATESPDDPPEAAIKRITREARDWVIESDNPAFPTRRLPTDRCPFPILGVYVGKV